MTTLLPEGCSWCAHRMQLTYYYILKYVFNKSLYFFCDAPVLTESKGPSYVALVAHRPASAPRWPPGLVYRLGIIAAIWSAHSSTWHIMFGHLSCSNAARLPARLASGCVYMCIYI